MNNAVYVSEEGIAEASASLLSCASELSELFDNINSVTTSIGSNVSGFTEIETVVDGLKQINSAKEALVNKINEFANYLTENVNPGYNAFQQFFAGLLGSSGSLFENLGNLFGFGSLGGNGYKDNGEGNNEDTSDEGYTGSHGGGGGGGSPEENRQKKREELQTNIDTYNDIIDGLVEENRTLGEKRYEEQQRFDNAKNANEKETARKNIDDLTKQISKNNSNIDMYRGWVSRWQAELDKLG